MPASDPHPKSRTPSLSPTKDISRRSLLQGATFAAGGAALAVAAATTQRAEAKMAEKAAGYQTSPKDGKSCKDCALFIAPSSCKLVDGTISPSGWCRFFVQKS
jgi:hypothetical protein